MVAPGNLLRPLDGDVGVGGPGHHHLDPLRLQVATKIEPHREGDVLLLQAIEGRDRPGVVAAVAGHDRDHVLRGRFEMLGRRRRGALRRQDSPGNETTTQSGDPEGQG
jgi:hypothetical protein